MTHPQSPKEAPSRPVVYVHATGVKPAGPEETQGLADSGYVVCSRSGGGGRIRTVHGYDQPGRLLRELADRFPGRPVALVRAGLVPTEAMLEELCDLLDPHGGPSALTLMSNCEAAWNPFAGLRAPAEKPEYEPAELVSLLAPGYLHTLSHWAGHFALLSSSAVERMAAEKVDGTLMQRLSAVGGSLAMPDHLFLHDRDASLYAAVSHETYESPYPPPFGDLSARLQEWMDSGIARLPFVPRPDRTATLHVTHNWGGGIAHWIRSFIEADGGHPHYQLRAEGPKSDQGCGQKLCLYAGNETRCALASWWLHPPIRSVEDTVPAYRAALEQVLRRHRIGRIIVSSFIGHSLDVLRTGLPTLQVLHDHFPLWPLLSVHPGRYLRDGLPVDLDTALAEHRGALEFRDKDAGAWSRIRTAYLEALGEFDVAIAAPGQSVMDLQARLEPGFDWQGARLIPHGSSVPGGRRSVAPRARSDGRLRMVVLGRIQAGKGQKLLLDSIERLSRLVQLYLLGSGKSGENFFGISGVDVIPEYDRDELPAILEAIGPHFAALVSIVPETFSYTLSELQLLGIPVIATRVGSFPKRIVNGRTGWLIEPDPQALVEQVEALCRSPEAIERVRAELTTVDVPATGDMLSSYNRALPIDEDPGRAACGEPGPDQAQLAASRYEWIGSRHALEDGEKQREELLGLQEELIRELESRTEWAQDNIRQLQREQQARREVEAWLASTQESLAGLNRQYQRLSGQHEELSGQYAELSNELATILGSRSWKVTRPLRAARRLAGNFVLARAWNPLRWPRLLSNFFGNVRRSGIRGALLRLQAVGEEPAPPPERPEPPPAPPRPPSFTETDRPDVSIVIPVYNNWPYTAACLQSLADAPGRHSFEVIVVDDESADESQEMLSAIDGLTYLRNERNLGFVGSCNRGARHARGEFLVMLNNDTQVTEGWLDALIDTLRSEPDAGLVGARLVYPDGRLQESGGIIFSDGSGWNYGRDDRADKPAYTFMREADYCSGACIALRTELFDRLGGFDERYSPAYYEDTDLAFRVREAGLKVLVQPAATVVHHEGITSGTDTSTGVKRYQRINQDTFVDRWRQELESQPAPVTEPRDPGAMRAASQHRVVENILWIGTLGTQADGHPHGERMIRLLECCRRLGYGVTFLAHETDDPEGLADLRANGIEVLDGGWLDDLPGFFGERGAGFDVVVASRHDVAARYRPLIKQHCRTGRFVFDTANVAFAAGPGVERDQEERLVRHTEITLVRVSDAVLVADPAEQEALAVEAPGKAVFRYGADERERRKKPDPDDCASLAELLKSLSPRETGAA